jgi:hypothetical protein
MILSVLSDAIAASKNNYEKTGASRKMIAVSNIPGHAALFRENIPCAVYGTISRPCSSLHC